jgi:hypothetical protein
MNTNRTTDPDESDDAPWWRLDFTMSLILLIALAVLLISTSELWHSHFGVH